MKFFKTTLIVFIICLYQLDAKNKNCISGVCKNVNEINFLTKSDKSTAFFGVDIGFSIKNYSKDNIKTGMGTSSVTSFSVGYNFYPFNYFGLRLYGNSYIDISSISNVAEVSISNPIGFTFNFDFLFDVYQSFPLTTGILLGFGFGYAFDTNNSKHHFYADYITPVNIGLFMLFNGNHKIELISRIGAMKGGFYADDVKLNFSKKPNYEISYSSVNFAYYYNF